MGPLSVIARLPGAYKGDVGLEFVTGRARFGLSKADSGRHPNVVDSDACEFVRVPTIGRDYVVTAKERLFPDGSLTIESPPSVQMKANGRDTEGFRSVKHLKLFAVSPFGCEIAGTGPENQINLRHSHHQRCVSLIVSLLNLGHLMTSVDPSLSDMILGAVFRNEVAYIGHLCHISIISCVSRFRRVKCEQMKPLDHALKSERRYGGVYTDYIDVHEFLDMSKAAHPDMRHRAILHNSLGPFIAVQVFGRTITNFDDRVVDVRQICEDHIIEDLGRLPTVSEFLDLIPISEIGRFAFKKGRRVIPGLDD